MKFALAILFALISFTGFSQKLTKKDKRAARRGEALSEPTTLDPGSAGDPTFAPTKSNGPKKAKSSKGPTYNSQKEYEERMASRAKTYRYNEKMLMKPQHYDPSYFGHKHKPKKHSAKKMKYCKECGIRH